MTEVKTIRVHIDTYKRFQKLGTYGDSANDILKRLLAVYEKTEGGRKIGEVIQ